MVSQASVPAITAQGQTSQEARNWEIVSTGDGTQDPANAGYGLSNFSSSDFKLSVLLPQIPRSWKLPASLHQPGSFPSSTTKCFLTGALCCGSTTVSPVSNHGARTWNCAGPRLHHAGSWSPCAAAAHYHTVLPARTCRCADGEAAGNIL